MEKDSFRDDEYFDDDEYFTDKTFGVTTTVNGDKDSKTTGLTMSKIFIALIMLIVLMAFTIGTILKTIV